MKKIVLLPTVLLLHSILYAQEREIIQKGHSVFEVTTRFLFTALNELSLEQKETFKKDSTLTIEQDETIISDFPRGVLYVEDYTGSVSYTLAAPGEILRVESEPIYLGSRRNGWFFLIICVPFIVGYSVFIKFKARRLQRREKVLIFIGLLAAALAVLKMPVSDYQAHPTSGFLATLASLLLIEIAIVYVFSWFGNTAPETASTASAPTK